MISISFWKRRCISGIMCSWISTHCLYPLACSFRCRIWLFNYYFLCFWLGWNYGNFIGDLIITIINLSWLNNWKWFSGQLIFLNIRFLNYIWFLIYSFFNRRSNINIRFLLIIIFWNIIFFWNIDDFLWIYLINIKLSWIILNFIYLKLTFFNYLLLLTWLPLVYIHYFWFLYMWLKLYLACS